MRAVTYEVDPQLLAERARLGHDKRDEMWDGVLHMVPPANGPHQRFGTQLILVVAPLCDARGLWVSGETGFFRTSDDYRVPDWAIYRPGQSSNRGIESAELVVEIRSPGDETMVKLPWYLAQGCREVLIVDRDTLDVELYGPAGQIDPARSEVLGCTFTTVDGPAVEVVWDDGSATLRHR